MRDLTGRWRIVQMDLWDRDDLRTWPTMGFSRLCRR
jgi:hypothetical protein